MIVKRYIITALKKLDAEYKRALSSSDPLYATYFAKLAVLEYCGWLEEALDNIVRRAVKGKLTTNSYRQIINSTIENTYGFQFKKHFRPMLIDALGIKKVEKIHNKFERSAKISLLTSELEAIKRERDNAAHTWYRNVTVTYQAPSNIIARFNNVYPILKEMYKEVSN